MTAAVMPTRETQWTSAWQASERRVAEALKTCAEAVEHSGPGRWELAFSNGSVWLAGARLEDGWLLLETPLATPPSKDFWRLLEWNGLLDGHAKFAIEPRARHLQARAEIPLDDEAGLAGRLPASCAGIRDALAWLHQNAAPKAQEEAEPAAERALPALLAELRWPFKERRGGRLAVELDVPGAYYQAVAEDPGAEGVRLWVELASCDGFSDRSREALAALLLTASGIVRVARPAVTGTNGEAQAGFEIRFGAPGPGAAELGDALGALSIACRLCGREAQALEDEALAREYLAIRGWSRGLTDESEQKGEDENGKALTDGSGPSGQ